MLIIKNITTYPNAIIMNDIDLSEDEVDQYYQNDPDTESSKNMSLTNEDRYWDREFLYISDFKRNENINKTPHYP